MVDPIPLVRDHQELRARLKVRIVKSIAGSPGCPPDKVAEYIVNALIEYPEGRDLLRQIVAHLDVREGSC